MVQRIDRRLEEQWSDLAADGRASPFVHPGWIKAWHQSFGRGELILQTEMRHGALAAALPLVTSVAGYRSPTNWHSPEFGPVATGQEVADALLGGLMLGDGHHIDLACLSQPDRDHFVRAAQAARRSHLFWKQQESPFVDTSGSWDAYRAQRSERDHGPANRSWLRRLERRRARLAREGDLVLDIQDGRANLEQLLEEGFGLEMTGWKGATGTAVLSSRVTRQFYWDVASWAAGQGYLRLAFLRLDRGAIAFDYCLETSERHFVLKSGFDQSLRNHSPGHILTHDMISRAFTLNLHSYELLGAAEAYKNAWTDQRRSRYRAMAFDRSLQGRTQWLVQAHGRRSAKALLRLLERRPSASGSASQ